MPAEAGLWHQARVVVRGEEIRLWGNGRPLPAVTDSANPLGGYVGLMSWGRCSLRRVRVSGTAAVMPAWDPAERPMRPWFRPWPTTEQRQSTGGLVRATNGDLLLVVDPVLLRSGDLGRTWQELWRAEAGVDTLGIPAVTRDGEVLFVRLSWRRPWTLEAARSRDHGRTWSGFEHLGELKLGDRLDFAFLYGSILTLKDGALLAFGWCQPENPGGVEVVLHQGMTWETYEIDTEPWAMGGMLEVAPDTVLWAYASGASQLRAQRFRITPEGVVPLPVEEEQLAAG